MNETSPGSSFQSSRIAPVTGSAVIIPPEGLSGGPETVINRAANLLAEESPDSKLVRPVSEVGEFLFSGSQSGSGLQIPNPQGVQLGHFRIESCVRKGGMGAVFKAVDLRLNRVVALKVLPPGSSHDPSIVQRFRHEAQAVAQLDHENIARVHYIGEEEGLHFIAFEFVNGSNLRDLISERGTIHPDDAVNYALQMAYALVHMHQHGVVHRDIKPSNIIVTPEGKAKLVDLGLARLEVRDPAEQLTVAGTTLGTFDYISPEQAKDPRLVDVRSDIYSLGCSLYHMLTGEPPYAEGTMLQKLLDHQAKDVPDPRVKNRFLSADLSAIVQKMMAPDPQGRYQTPEQLIRDLMYVSESMGLQRIWPYGPVWASSPYPRQTFLQRHGGWLIFAAVLMLFVAYLKYSDDFSARNRAVSPAEIPANSGSRIPVEVSDGNENDSNETEGARNSDSPPKGKPTADQSIVEEPLRNPDTTLSIGDPPQRTEAAEVSTPKTSTEEKLPLTSPREVFSDGKDLPVPFDKGEDAPDETGVAAGKPVETAPTDDIKSPVTVDPGTSSADPPVDLDKSSPFILLGSAGAADRRYPTLEAACSDSVDGSIIELRFDGVQRQRPIRVTKKITIRAAQGKSPQLEIAPLAGTTDDGRLITVSGGSLSLVKVNLIARSSEHPASEIWTLFSVQRGEQLRLEDTAVTLVQSSGRRVKLVEFRPSEMDSLMGLDAGKSPTKSSPFRVELENSMIRGDGDVFQVSHTQGLRISVKNSIVVVNGTLLRSEGTSDTSRPSIPIEIQLERNTLVVNGGLIACDAGELPRALSRIDLRATNNIITAIKQPDVAVAPLVFMTGNLPQDNFTRLLEWNGLKNFYDPFEIFWSTQSTYVTGKNVSLKFADWVRFWGSEREVDANTKLIFWLEGWSKKPFSSLTPWDFTLDSNVPRDNPAIAGANDGGDAGVDLEELSKLRVDPLERSSAGVK